MNGIFQISMEADMVDKIILGQRLKGLRESAGLSQKQLADCLSIGQNLVSKIEGWGVYGKPDADRSNLQYRMLSC